MDYQRVFQLGVVSYGVLVALSLYEPERAYGQSTEPSHSAQLLDEVVAGSEANLQLVEHGRATYKHTTGSAHQPAEHNQSSTYTVTFDYPFVRVDAPDHILVHTPELVIWYPTRMGHAPEYPAYEHRAVISDPATAKPLPFHPRIQHEHHLPDVAILINSQRKNPKATLTAERDGDGSIVIRYESPDAHFRAIFVVGPSFGYSLTRVERYSLKASSTVPLVETTLSYLRIPNGGYIVDEREAIYRLRASVDGPYQILRSVTRLVDFDPARPSPDVFRLESIGLPEGARIDDQINQRRYIFGVTAVTEDDIGTVEVTGPWRGRAPRRVLLIGTLAIGLVVLWFGVIRRRFRR